MRYALAFLLLTCAPVGSVGLQSTECTQSEWQCFIDQELPAAESDVDRTAAIQGAIDLLPAPGYRLLARPTLRLPYGTWSLDSGVVVDVPVEIDGQGSALLIPSGVTAITVARTASSSAIRHLTIGSTAPDSPHTGLGIEVRAPRAIVEDVLVRDVGNGFYFNGRGDQSANADGMYVAATQTYQVKAVGYRLQGADANGGVFVGNIAWGGTVGLQDDSFLGNAHIGWQFHTTAEEAIVVSSPANFSSFTGTYIEGDCGHALPAGRPSVVGQFPVTWLGGVAPAYQPAGDRIGYGRSRIYFGEEDVNGRVLSVTMPNLVSQAVFGASYTGAHSFQLRWRIQAGLPPVAGFFQNDPLRMPVGWTDEPGDENTARFNAPGAFPQYPHLGGMPLE